VTIRRSANLALLGFMCAWLIACKRYGNSWEAKLEKDVSGTFYSNESGYGNLLRAWEVIYPNRCGGSAAPGLVSEQAIIAQEGTYTVDVNGQSSSV